MPSREEIAEMADKIMQEFTAMVYFVLKTCDGPDQVRELFEISLAQAEALLAKERKAAVASDEKREQGPAAEAEKELARYISQIREAGFTVEGCETFDGVTKIRVGGRWMTLDSLLMLGKMGQLNVKNIQGCLE